MCNWQLHIPTPPSQAGNRRHRAGPEGSSLNLAPTDSDAPPYRRAPPRASGCPRTPGRVRLGLGDGSGGRGLKQWSGMLERCQVLRRRWLQLEAERDNQIAANGPLRAWP